MKIKLKTKTRASRAADIVITVLMSLTALALLVPLITVILRAFSPEKNYHRFEVIPSEFSFEPFEKLLESSAKMPFGRYFFNTFLVSLISAAVQVPIAAGAAYVLSKIKTPAVRLFNRLLEWSLVLTPASLAVSSYVIMSETGVINTYFALFLPLMTSPLSVFLLKKSMDAVPDELVDCAVAEGATHAKICFSMILPNVKPTCFAISAAAFAFAWTQSGGVSVFSEEIKPFAALLAPNARAGETAVFYALGVLIILPIAAIFIIFFKKISFAFSLAGIKTSRPPKNVPETDYTLELGRLQSMNRVSFFTEEPPAKEKNQRKNEKTNEKNSKLKLPNLPKFPKPRASGKDDGALKDTQNSSKKVKKASYSEQQAPDEVPPDEE